MESRATKEGDAARSVRRDGRSLAAGVYEQLRSMLRDGRLKPGMRIREIDIADAMGVSRTPVREALSRLQSRGLVELSNGGLSVVAFTQAQVIELYALRGILEGAAARFAAENAFPAELTKLRYILSLFKQSRTNHEEFSRVNTMFNSTLYEAAHNRYQKSMLDDLNSYFAMLPSTTLDMPGRIAGIEKQHKRVLEAIERRDPDAAENAARDAVRESLEARLKLMFAHDGS